MQFQVKLTAENKHHVQDEAHSRPNVEDLGLLAGGGVKDVCIHRHATIGK